VADCPNGMITMSKDLEGIVETSTNLSLSKPKTAKLSWPAATQLTEKGKTKLPLTYALHTKPPASKLKAQETIPAGSPILIQLF